MKLAALVAAALATLAVFAARAAPATTTFVHFKSPSGNINCLGSGSASPQPGAPTIFVDCLVKQAAWAHRPSKPARCDLDWAPTDLELSNRHVAVGSCRGDIGPLCGPYSGSACTTLAYGHSVNIGTIRCTSATRGVTCRYRTAPRIGFRIAREGYTVFHS